MIHRSKIEGIAMLAVAALCFWLPQYMKQPGPASGKILVATPALEHGPFGRTVILVVQEDGYSATGFVLNATARPGDTPSGGPLLKDEYFTLHSLEMTNDQTQKLEALNMGWTQGEDFVRAIGSATKKPAEYVTLKGQAGWGMGDLEDEIERDNWKVIDFDRNLVFHTAPAKMYEAASKK